MDTELKKKGVMSVSRCIKLGIRLYRTKRLITTFPQEEADRGAGGYG